MKKMLFVLGLAATQAFAQSASNAPVSNPLSGGTKMMYAHMKNLLLKSAEEMPEQNYSFKPVSTVRTFGEIVGHVAESQYEFCSAVIGDGKKAPDVEKSKTSKADLIQALKDGFAYCDQAYNNMTDAHAAEMVKFFDRDAPKLSILSFNCAHSAEHYGNIVTYLRIKGLVPPSTQEMQQREQSSSSSSAKR
jgi:uncharacterized damage-inducible protein DinB